LKIYSEKREKGGSHGCIKVFGNIEDLDDKSLGASETLVLRCTRAVMGQGTYIHRLYEDRACTMDGMMKTCV
jgi:hypothetical protein